MGVPRNGRVFREVSSKVLQFDLGRFAASAPQVFFPVLNRGYHKSAEGNIGVSKTRTLGEKRIFNAAISFVKVYSSVDKN